MGGRRCSGGGGTAASHGVVAVGRLLGCRLL